MAAAAVAIWVECCLLDRHLAQPGHHDALRDRALVALRLAGEKATLGADHQLVGPGSLRSAVLAPLYQQVRTGDLQERDALSSLDRMASMKIRLLTDRVSRRMAWKVAADLKLVDTRLADYVAVASLQADVLITDDPELTHPSAL